MEKTSKRSSKLTGRNMVNALMSRFDECFDRIVERHILRLLSLGILCPDVRPSLKKLFHNPCIPYLGRDVQGSVAFFIREAHGDVLFQKGIDDCHTTM